MSIDVTSLKIPQEFIELIQMHKDELGESFFTFLNSEGSSILIDLTDVTQRTHWHNIEIEITQYVLSNVDFMTNYVKTPKKITENDYDQFCQFYRWMGEIRSVLNKMYPNETKWIFPTEFNQDDLGLESTE